MVTAYSIGFANRKGGAFMNLIEKDGIPIMFKSLIDVKKFYAKFYKTYPRTRLEVFKGKIDENTNSNEDLYYIGYLEGGKYYKD